MLHYIEEHPYLSGSVVVGLIVLFILIRRGSSAGGGSISVNASGPSESLQAAGLSANAQLQATQLAAQVQIASINAHVNETELLSAADTFKTKLGFNYALESLYQGVDYGKYQTDASLKLGLAQLGAANPIPTGYPSGPAYIYGVYDQHNLQQTSETAAQSQITQAIPYQGQTIVHGVVEEDCTALPFGSQGSCANRNTQRVQASYDAHAGSFMGMFDGKAVYANTPEARAIYGPPKDGILRVPYPDDRV